MPVWVVAGIAVALLLSVIALALVMPLRLVLRIDTDPWRIDLRLAPFAGLVGEFGLPRRPLRRQATPPRPRQRSAARRLPMLRALPTFLGALVERTRIDRMRVDLRFGTGDPALTGQIYGRLMPLTYGVGGGQTADLRIMPEFDRACLAGRAEVVMRVTPVRLVRPVLWLLRAGYGRS